MLLTEFFNNPMGKGASVLNIKSIKENYDRRYNTFYKNISHTAFFIKNNIYVSINIPSSVKGIFYDVVIKFTPNTKSAGVSVSDMDFQFFSNSPSFLYTYANAYAKRKLLIKELNSKLSKEMIKTIAATRNPYAIVSYDITIYSAIKYLLTNGFDKINALKMNSIESSNLTQLLRSIQDWETLQKNRKIQKNVNKIEEEEERAEKIKYSSKTTPIIESDDGNNSEDNTEDVNDGKIKKNILEVKKNPKIKSPKTSIKTPKAKKTKKTKK